MGIAEACLQVSRVMSEMGNTLHLAIMVVATGLLSFTCSR